jgi:hypothetical protein
MEQTPEAVHHLCFDRDRAGQMFAINFALQLDKRVFTSYLSANKEQLIINDMTDGFQRHELPLEDFDFNGMCDKLKIDRSRMEYLPCDARYKDWNDELLDKPMEQTENQQKGVRR